ncbi:MAG: polymer-forming cytoskeletal protein [Gammaproteobacteria bacterium]|nr:polymer-forming cytoskeletal protein [Gammaproteobacteria bacterium]
MSIKKRRRIMDEVQQFTTLIGQHSEFIGQLEGSDNSIINGSVKGDGRFEAVVVLGEQGRWQGTINAPYAIISGRVEGTVIAGNKLEVTRTARIKGTITAPMVAIEEGAVHDGEIRMQGNTEVVRFRERRLGPDESAEAT